MVLGYIAMAATLFLWSGFFLSLRGGPVTSLHPADIALARFVIPTLVLMPFVAKYRAQLKATPVKYLFGVTLGSGLPYLLVAGTAMQTVPVAHGSAMIPGTLPLFVSAIAVLFYHQALSKQRIIGLIAVLLGISSFLLSNLGGSYQSELLQGHGLLLLGSLMWAIFTISARVANLNTYACAGLVAIFSLVMLLAAISFGWLPSLLAETPVEQWPWKALTWHLLLQGVGAGLLASFTFIYSIKTIGAEASAALGSLTPVVATLLAYLVFNEIPDNITLIALMFVTGGSILASNVFMNQAQHNQYQPHIRR
ncbi:DMT family transporter [Vibrio sp. CAU 1672]|uniref:DMT family transporter n=1 Tax=Vibrio sp. CAU 1672 TaxID=3032594 RepID=UPI0023D9B469|nr:DMT family transporter [Vibrio sp. CAU 1672]MDF2155333.1 DMT family transporter [Vibrio sp. CAU 1672]